MIDEKVINEYNISLKLDNPLCKKVILTDCMDTVVSRNMPLDGVIKEWAKKVGKKYGLNERFLCRYRRDVVLGSMHNVVPIEKIYQELFMHCAYYGLLAESMENDFVHDVHKIELDIELGAQSLIAKTADFLACQKERGCKIFCVSDFRLPASDISQFFEHQKIGGLFDGVFSSCEIGKTKKEGSIYQTILDLIKESPSNCMMIGDNLKSDCVNACKNGISACLIL